MLGNGKVAALTIANGGTTSNVLSDFLGDAESFIIQAPGALAEVPTIEVSWDNTTFATLNDGTADIKAPAAGKAIPYRTQCLGAAPYLRIKLGGAAAAERVFHIMKQDRF